MAAAGCESPSAGVEVTVAAQLALECCGSAVVVKASA